MNDVEYKAIIRLSPDRDSLQHEGKKGMRWGVRKGKEMANKWAAKSESRAMRNAELKLKRMSSVDDSDDDYDEEPEELNENDSGEESREEKVKKLKTKVLKKSKTSIRVNRPGYNHKPMQKITNKVMQMNNRGRPHN